MLGRPDSCQFEPDSSALLVSRLKNEQLNFGLKEHTLNYFLRFSFSQLAYSSANLGNLLGLLLGIWESITTLEINSKWTQAQSTFDQILNSLISQSQASISVVEISLLFMSVFRIPTESVELLAKHKVLYLKTLKIIDDRFESQNFISKDFSSFLIPAHYAPKRFEDVVVEISKKISPKCCGMLFSTFFEKKTLSCIYRTIKYLIDSVSDRTETDNICRILSCLPRSMISYDILLSIHDNVLKHDYPIISVLFICSFINRPTIDDDFLYRLSAQLYRLDQDHTEITLNDLENLHYSIDSVCTVDIEDETCIRLGTHFCQCLLRCSKAKLDVILGTNAFGFLLFLRTLSLISLDKFTEVLSRLKGGVQTCKMIKCKNLLIEWTAHMVIKNTFYKPNYEEMWSDYCSLSSECFNICLKKWLQFPLYLYNINIIKRALDCNDFEDIWPGLHALLALQNGLNLLLDEVSLSVKNYNSTSTNPPKNVGKLFQPSLMAKELDQIYILLSASIRSRFNTAFDQRSYNIWCVEVHWEALLNAFVLCLLGRIYLRGFLWVEFFKHFSPDSLWIKHGTTPDHRLLCYQLLERINSRVCIQNLLDDFPVIGAVIVQQCYDISTFNSATLSTLISLDQFVRLKGKGESWRFVPPTIERSLDELGGGSKQATDYLEYLWKQIETLTDTLNKQSVTKLVKKSTDILKTNIIIKAVNLNLIGKLSLDDFDRLLDKFVDMPLGVLQKGIYNLTSDCVFLLMNRLTSIFLARDKDEKANCENFVLYFHAALVRSMLPFDLEIYANNIFDMTLVYSPESSNQLKSILFNVIFQLSCIFQTETESLNGQIECALLGRAISAGFFILGLPTAKFSFLETTNSIFKNPHVEDKTRVCCLSLEMNPPEAKISEIIIVILRLLSLVSKLYQSEVISNISKLQKLSVMHGISWESLMLISGLDDSLNLVDSDDFSGLDCDEFNIDGF